jgi:hypothetical protein
MGSVWTRFVDYWYGEYPPPTVLSAPKEYICSGCGSRVSAYVVREYNGGINRYFCTVKCFEKPAEKQAIR